MVELIDQGEGPGAGRAVERECEHRVQARRSGQRVADHRIGHRHPRRGQRRQAGGVGAQAEAQRLVGTELKSGATLPVATVASLAASPGPSAMPPGTPSSSTVPVCCAWVTVGMSSSSVTCTVPVSVLVRADCRINQIDQDVGILGVGVA